MGFFWNSSKIPPPSDPMTKYYFCVLFFLSCLFLSNLFPKEMRYLLIPIMFVFFAFVRSLFKGNATYWSPKMSSILFILLVLIEFISKGNAIIMNRNHVCIFCFCQIFSKEMRYTGVKKCPWIIQISITCTFVYEGFETISKFFKNSTAI